MRQLTAQPIMAPLTQWCHHSKSHSGTREEGQHLLHWLCSTTWCCMVDKHSHKGIKSSFKQIDASLIFSVCLHWHDSACSLLILQSRLIVSHLLFLIDISIGFFLPFYFITSHIETWVGFLLNFDLILSNVAEVVVSDRVNMALHPEYNCVRR